MDLKELKKLRLNKNDFAVFGSGPLAIRGLRDNNDIDIIVKQKLWEKLCKSNTPVDESEKLIRLGKIEVYKNWSPWFENVDKLIDEADVFEGIRFVKLERVLEWKKKFNREKDQADIKIIEEFLGNTKKA